MVANRPVGRLATIKTSVGGWGIRFFSTLLLLSIFLSACSGSTPPVMYTPRPSATPSATPAPTHTVTPTITSTPTITPTRTLTPTVTLTPTPTATPLPAMAGTPLPQFGGQIIQSTLKDLRIMAQWGRGQVNGLAWAAGGSRIAVATPLGVYLYDPATLANPQMIDTRARAYRLTLSEDGARLAVDTAPVGTGEDLSVLPHKVQVWDISAAPKMLLEFANGGQALALSFNDAGGLDLITRAEKGAVFQRWNLADQHLEQAVNLLGGESAVEAVFSPDRTRAATHGSKGPVRLWQLSNGLNIATTPESGANAGPMAFSPDGLLLAVAYPDETKDFINTNEIRVWRFPPEGGRVDQPVFTLADGIHPEGMEEAMISLAWSADNRYIAAGYQDQTVHVWKAEASFVFKRFTGATLSRFLAFGPRGDTQTRLAGGGLEIWSVEDGTLLAHDDNYLPGLFDMQFTADGSQLALAEYGLIDFRGLANGARVQTITGMTGAVYSLSFDPKGNYLVAGCQDGTTRLYRVRDGRYLDQLGQPTYPIRSVAFSTNSFWIAASSEDMRIRVIRLDDGLVIDSFAEPFVAYKLLFSPNSDQLASLTTSGVNLREVGGTERQTEITLQGNVGGVGLSDMAYSPGQEYLALVGSGVVRVIEPVTRELAYSIYEPKGALPWSVAFSPDNAFLAVGYSDGQIRFYWAQTGMLMHSIQAHPASVERLIFSRDGTMLASLGAEGTIRVWGVGK